MMITYLIPNGGNNLKILKIESFCGSPTPDWNQSLNTQFHFGCSCSVF